MADRLGDMLREFRRHAPSLGKYAWTCLGDQNSCKRGEQCGSLTPDDSVATIVAKHVYSARGEHRQRKGGQPHELFGISEGRPERHPLVQELIDSTVRSH